MLGEASLAVPVADRDGEAVAAVAVVLPASEQPVAESVLTLLRETARNVSRELGAGSWPPSSPLATDAEQSQLHRRAGASSLHASCASCARSAVKLRPFGEVRCG